MKALSIRQPWAWLIIHAGKDIENRSWRTHFRGRFLVHASAGCSRAEYEDACQVACELEWLFELKVSTPPPFEQIQRGGIIGSVELVDCVGQSDSVWCSNGNFGFALRDPIPLPFRPYKGQLGFFEVPE